MCLGNARLVQPAPPRSPRRRSPNARGERVLGSPLSPSKQSNSLGASRRPFPSSTSPRGRSSQSSCTGSGSRAARTRKGLNPPETSSGCAGDTSSPTRGRVASAATTASEMRSPTSSHRSTRNSPEPSLPSTQARWRSRDPNSNPGRASHWPSAGGSSKSRLSRSRAGEQNSSGGFFTATPLPSVTWIPVPIATRQECPTGRALRPSSSTMAPKDASATAQGNVRTGARGPGRLGSSSQCPSSGSRRSMWLGIGSKRHFRR